MDKKDPVDVLREEIMAHPNLEKFFTEKVGMNLRQYMTGYVIDNTSVEELVDELDLQHSRCCSECGKPMYEGFFIEDGDTKNSMTMGMAIRIGLRGWIKPHKKEGIP